MVLIKLMDQEQQYMLKNSFPITTISFYLINDGDGYSFIEEKLNARFEEILTANPWLCGRLIEYKDEKQILLSFDTPIHNPQYYSSFVTDDQLFQLSEWRSIWDHVWSFVPKLGVECVDRDEPLCRFVVFKNTSRKKFALMFALNHTIGDGYTYYTLWKMLDFKETVWSMNVNRASNVEGLFVEQGSVSSGLWIHKIIEVAERNNLNRSHRKLCQVFMRKVSNESLKRAKEKYSSGNCFVSTNDILCNWLFGGCKNSQTMNMTVNMRGRTPLLTNNMAGNYIVACPVTISESPLDFRQKWSSILKGERTCDGVEGDNWSANWLSLYHQVEIQGCTHALHLPVFQWSDLEDLISDVTDSFMYVFRLNKQDAGVVIGLNKNTFDRNFVDKCDLLETLESVDYLGKEQNDYFLRGRTRVSTQ